MLRLALLVLLPYLSATNFRPYRTTVVNGPVPLQIHLAKRPTQSLNLPAKSDNCPHPEAALYAESR